MTTSDINQTVARKVEEAMKAAGESPSSLALATGIHRTTLTRRLAGTSSFDITELHKIGTVLHIKPFEFLLELAA
jgi:hypothetical protein